MARQLTITVISLDLGRFMGWEIPEEIIDPARQLLEEAVGNSKLRGAMVKVFGGDFHVHVTTQDRDHSASDAPDPFRPCVQIALEAALLVLKDGLATQRCLDEARKIFDLKRETQAQTLKMRCLDFPFTERGAEPIFVAKALDAACGFFNRALFNLFFNPDKGSGRRIEGNDYLGVVESIEDLCSNRSVIRTYEFGPGQVNEMLALVADAEEWCLSRIYSVAGKFSQSELGDEPAAVVEGTFNPVLIGRSQSGLPAIGEFTQAVGEFYFGPGGKQGRYRVGLMPVNFQQACYASSPTGSARVAAYAYQSYDNGRIPGDKDVIDVFSQNRPETVRLQRDATRLIQKMTSHGEFEPYVNPHAAEAQASKEGKGLEWRFETIPKGTDPLLEAANQKAVFTLSDIKADSGGKVGHTSPPHHFRSVAQASLEEAKKTGLIFDTSEIIEVGDDGHLLMTHSKGADNNDIHLFAYRTFFRQVWVAEVLRYKWYGLGQDLVGEASAGHSTEELAHLNDEFLQLLPRFLPPKERAQASLLQEAYLRWKTGTDKGRTPLQVFSGNVSGQGPGFAELPLTRPGRIGLLAIDKAGPSAFNLPIWWSLNQALDEGLLPRFLKERGASGIVLEVWDVEHHRRIFLDWESEVASIRRLLGAVERFNVKRVWSRITEDWSPENPGASLGEILLAASTEKLAVITGGEYRGKDDPVLLSVDPLARSLNNFMRDCFYLTQGDGRGSHFMFPTPLSFRDAVATINSRAVAVSAWISLDSTGQIRVIQDVFSDPSYEAARDRAYLLNKAIWDAQGGNFIPVGVGASKVEQSYPLAKTLARITAPDSGFVSRRTAHRIQANHLEQET